MKREIKFRAWNGEHMYGIEGLRWILFGSPEEGKAMRVDERGQNDWKDIRLDDKNCALMQYTGLKDKNGKEIYEGDIVKILYWHEKGRDYYKKVKMEYKRVSGSDDMGTDMIGFEDVEGGEILGNIYENPELLSNLK